MIIQTPTANQKMPGFHESSWQRSRRDADSALLAWKKNKIATGQTEANTRAISVLWQSVNRMRRRIVGGGGTSTNTSTNTGGLNPRGVYVSGVSYSTNDFVIIRAGPAAGSYYSVIDNNTNDPATGIGWMQFAPGNTEGSWT